MKAQSALNSQSDCNKKKKKAFSGRTPLERKLNSRSFSIGQVKMNVSGVFFFPPYVMPVFLASTLWNGFLQGSLPHKFLVA